MTKKQPERARSTGKRPQWISQIARDKELPSRSVRFGVGLASFVNDESGMAWPGKRKLAEACGMSVRNLPRAWAPLVARKHLEIGRGMGQFSTNLYRIVLADAGDDTLVIPGGQIGSDGVTGSVVAAGHPCHPNLVEPCQEPGAASAGACGEAPAPAAPGYWWDDHPAWTKVASSLDRLARVHLSMCALEAHDVLATRFPLAMRGIKARKNEIEAALGHAIVLKAAEWDEGGATKSWR